MILDKNGVQFKVGSAVKFDGNRACPPDVGVITKINENGRIEAVWELDGIGWFDTNTRDEFTVITDSIKDAVNSATDEIIVTLHTESGKVKTAYPNNMLKDAMELFAQYCADGKKVSMSHGVEK